MPTTAKLIEKVDQAYGGSCAEIARDIYGEDYGKGVDIARRFEREVKKRSIADFRPPIFALTAAHDRGELVGFGLYFGIPPESPLESVGKVIQSRFGFQVDFIYVNTPDELLLPAESFMIDNERGEVRLPAVRICPVLPTASETV